MMWSGPTALRPHHLYLKLKVGWEGAAEPAPLTNYYFMYEVSYRCNSSPRNIRLNAHTQHTHQFTLRSFADIHAAIIRNAVVYFRHDFVPPLLDLLGHVLDVPHEIGSRDIFG